MGLNSISVVDYEENGKVTAIKRAISGPGFPISLEVFTLVLSVTKPLSEKLQGSKQGLMCALGSVQSCTDILLHSYRDIDKFIHVFS